MMIAKHPGNSRPQPYVGTIGDANPLHPWDGHTQYPPPLPMSQVIRVPNFKKLLQYLQLEFFS